MIDYICDEYNYKNALWGVTISIHRKNKELSEDGMLTNKFIYILTTLNPTSTIEAQHDI